MQRSERLRSSFCVQDAGIGLKAEEMERLFEAFYTTKPPRHGYGFGHLSLDYRGPWRPFAGRAKPEARGNVPVHPAGRAGALWQSQACRAGGDCGRQPQIMNLVPPVPKDSRNPVFLAAKIGKHERMGCLPTIGCSLTGTRFGDTLFHNRIAQDLLLQTF